MKRKVYLKRKKPLFVNARLAKKFSLDRLEYRILLEAQSETFEEIAEELGELSMLVRVRVIRSIPAKLGTTNLSEARKKLKRELVLA